MPVIYDTTLTFSQVAALAVADFAENGYDSEVRFEEWLTRLRNAALRSLMPQAQVEEQLRATLENIYRRLIDRGEVLRTNPGAGRFTIDRVRPELRLELNRRIAASASLIKLNRARAVEETLQRFAGWATSVPAGGTPPGIRREAVASVKKALGSLPYVERRLHIDQGHKFAAALSATLAKGSGAIAARWRTHYTRNPRHAHKLRDGRVYLIRGTWAMERGLVKPQPGSGYTDEMEQPGDFVNCRCSFTYLNNLRDLPPEMLTQEGREALDEARRRAAA